MEQKLIPDDESNELGSFEIEVKSENDEQTNDLIDKSTIMENNLLAISIPPQDSC